MSKFSVKLYDKEELLLSEFMKQNNIKNKADAVRKCIKLAVNFESRNDLLLDINDKLNRIIYRENIQKNYWNNFMQIWNFQLITMLKLNKVLLDFMKIIISI